MCRSDVASQITFTYKLKVGFLLSLSFAFLLSTSLAVLIVFLNDFLVAIVVVAPIENTKLTLFLMRGTLTDLPVRNRELVILLFGQR